MSKLTWSIKITGAFYLAAFTNFVEAVPQHSAELIFPLETWHNHGSCIVEASNGDLIVCWFHGSGERKSDDVMILELVNPKAPNRGANLL